MTTGNQSYRTGSGDAMSFDDTQDVNTSGTTSSARSGQSASSAAKQGVDQAKQTASNVTDQVKQTASGAMDQAKQTAVLQASTQKERASDAIDAVSEALNRAADTLRNDNQSQIAQVADFAASNITQLSSYLRQRDVNDLIGEVEDIARRQPAIFLGGAFLLGIVGARFLKSASGGQPRGSSYRSRYRFDTGNRSGYAGRYDQYGQYNQAGYYSPSSQYGQSLGGSGASAATGQYGNQYAPYNDYNNGGMPNTGTNVNTGGLAFGANMPAGGVQPPLKTDDIDAAGSTGVNR